MLVYGELCTCIAYVLVHSAGYGLSARSHLPRVYLPHSQRHLHKDTGTELEIGILLLANLTYLRTHNEPASARLHFAGLTTMFCSFMADLSPLDLLVSAN